MKIKGKQLENTLRTESAPFTSVYSDDFIGDLNGGVRFSAKNASGGTMTRGQAVYISGLSGQTPEVSLAQANNSSTMPAFGIVQTASANANASVEVTTFGNLVDYTNSYTQGSELYVSESTAGLLTETKPTGASNLIQNLAKVVRTGSSGRLKVGGAGRTNATPNLDNGTFFIGDSSNCATNSAYTLPTTDGSANQVLTTDGAGAVSFADSSGGGTDPITVDYATFGTVTANAITSTTISISNQSGSTSTNDVWWQRSAGFLGIGSGASLSQGDTILFGGGIYLSSTLQPQACGLYEVTSVVGVNSVFSVIFTRLSSFDSDAEIKNGTRIYVENDVWSGYECVVTRPSSFTLGTTAVTVTPVKSDIGAWNVVTVENSATTYSPNAGDCVFIPSTWNGGTLTITMPEDPKLGHRIKIMRGGGSSSDTVKVGLGSNSDQSYVFDGLTTSGSFIEKIFLQTLSTLEMTCVQNEQNTVNAASKEVWYCDFMLNHPLPLDLTQSATATDFDLNIVDGRILQWNSTGGTTGYGAFEDVAIPNSSELNSAITGTTTLNNPTGAPIYEEIYLINAGSASTITLPDPASGATVPSGFKYQIKSVGTGVVTIDTASGTIDGASSFALSSQYSSVSLVCDGSNYYII